MKPWQYQKECFVHIEDQYPSGTPPIPDGWEAVEFRPPKAGEYWLSGYSSKKVQASGDYAPECPRIILKRKELSFEVGDCFTFGTGSIGVILSWDSGHPGREARSMVISPVNNQYYMCQPQEWYKTVCKKTTKSEFLEALWNSIVPPPLEAAQ